MPSIIASTTPRQLEAAIIATIMAIVPTEESHRDAGWTPMEGNREEGQSSMVPRLYYVEMTPGGLVPSGITGNGDSECYLAMDVYVDYRVFEEQEVGTIIAQDQWDLYDALESAIGGTPGLTAVSIDGEPTLEDEESVRYRYPLMLKYMRARTF